MEPVLVIGLGGIGSLICQAVRRRMLRDAALKTEVDEGIAQFLVLDTAAACWAEDLGTVYEPLAYNFMAATACRTLARTPFFPRSWPPEYQPGFAIKEGGQVRINGRLSYLEHVINRRPRVFMDRVRLAYSKALNYWNTREQGNIDRRQLTIALCGSSSGGTCSGILIDVAFAIKSFVERQGGNVDPEVVVFLLDHEAVALSPAANVEPARLRANHAALMLELEYWANNAWGEKAVNEAACYDVTYPETGLYADLNLSVRSAGQHSPVKLVFHIGGTFWDGSVLHQGSYESLVNLAAEGLYTVLRSPAGLANFATRAAASELGPNGFTQRHGSFGMIGLRVPVEMIAEHLAARRAQPIMALALGSASAALAEAEQAAAAFLVDERLREKDADEVITRLLADHPSVAVIAPPDIEATVEGCDESSWRTDLASWQAQYDDYRKQLDERTRRHAADLVSEKVDVLGRRIREWAARSLAEGVGFCDALRVQLQVHQHDLQKNRSTGIEVLRKQLQADGLLGSQRFDQLQRDLEQAYGRFFNRGLSAAKNALAQFLLERLEAQKTMAAQEEAFRVYGLLLAEVDRWSQACRWVKERAEGALKKLADELGGGCIEASRLVPPLAAEIDFAAKPAGMRSALELHVLGSADVVDEVVTTAAWPDADRPETLEERKRMLLDRADTGVVALIAQVKRARELHDQGQPSEWPALQQRADSGEVARGLAATAKSVMRQGFEAYLERLTVDKALELEAAFVVGRRRDRLAEILGPDGRKAVETCLATQGEAEARRLVIGYRLAGLQNKALLAMQRADQVENVGGPPAHEAYVLSGSASANPVTWALLTGKIPGLQIDDRGTEEGEDWGQRIILTYLAYGVELWWLASFHRAFEAYSNWCRTRDLNRFPLHTDRRYGTEWPFMLPVGESDVEVMAAFYVLYAHGQIEKAPAGGHFTLHKRNNREVDQPLGRGSVEAIDALLQSSSLSERVRNAKRQVLQQLRSKSHFYTRQRALLNEALDLAHKEADLATGTARLRAERYRKVMIAYITDFETKAGSGLAAELSAIVAQGVDPKSIRFDTFDRSQVG